MKELFNFRTKRGIVFLCYCILIALTVCFIFNNSSFSKEESAAQSESLASFIKPIIDFANRLSFNEFEHIVRKLAHFSEFGLLGVELALLAFHISRKFKPRDAVYAAFASLLIADLDEFLQLFTERGSMVSDVFIDFSGALCGIAAGYILMAVITSIRKKAHEKKLNK